MFICSINFDQLLHKWDFLTLKTGAWTERHVLGLKLFSEQPTVSVRRRQPAKRRRVLPRGAARAHSLD